MINLGMESCKGFTPSVSLEQQISVDGKVTSWERNVSRASRMRLLEQPQMHNNSPSRIIKRTRPMSSYMVNSPIYMAPFSRVNVNNQYPEDPDIGI